MHKALVKIDADSGALVFRARGHANYAEKGEDIICASASVLTMTLAKLVTEAYNNGWIAENDATVHLTAEETEISCVTEDADIFGELARAYLYTASGYELIAAHYPKYIHFKSQIRL